VWSAEGMTGGLCAQVVKGPAFLPAGGALSWLTSPLPRLNLEVKKGGKMLMVGGERGRMCNSSRLVCN
jgi:hypothetical protein